jgi:hypothetical protein
MSVLVRFYIKLKEDTPQAHDSIRSIFEDLCSEIYVDEDDGYFKPIDVKEMDGCIIPSRNEFGWPITDSSSNSGWYWIYSYTHYKSSQHKILARALLSSPLIDAVATDTDMTEYYDEKA